MDLTLPKERNLLPFILGVIVVAVAFYFGTKQSILFYEYLPNTVPEEGILVFYQPSCPKCIEEIPVLQKLLNEGYKIHAIDVYERPDIAALFGVKVTPTIIILPQNVRLEGAVTYEDVIRAIEEGIEVRGEGCAVDTNTPEGFVCGPT